MASDSAKWNLLENICDVLNFDISVLPHLEATYYTRESQLHLRQQELLRLTSDKPVQRNLVEGVTGSSLTREQEENRQYSLEDYNNWRRERLVIATVEEKLKWNQIRRSILEQTKSKVTETTSPLQQKQPVDTRTNVTSIVCQETWQRVCELVEEVAREQSDLQKLWTEIVNYRAQISLANTLRAILAKHS